MATQTPNPTYRHAATFAFERVIDLIADYSVFAPVNGYWHMANTLDTCLQHLLIEQKSPRPDSFNLVKNALDKVFDSRMRDKGESVEATDWGEWSRHGDGPWADDYGWWGVALITAYRNRGFLGYDETFSNRILKYARNCFTALAYGWDPSEAVEHSDVKGGAWNHQDLDQALTGRNNVTNEVLWIFSQRISDLDPNNEIYKDQVAASQKFFFDAKKKKASEDGALLNAKGLVRERLLGMQNGYPGWYWVGDQGLFMGACLGHGDTAGAKKLAEKVTANMLDSKAVLHDTISPNSDFNDDYATGKGVFMRNWKMFLGVSEPNRPTNFQDLITANAKAVWNNRVTPEASGRAQYQFGFNWNPAGKPFKKGGKGGEPTYPNGDENPSTFSLLVCQVAGLAALNAACLLQSADVQIPA